MRVSHLVLLAVLLAAVPARAQTSQPRSEIIPLQYRSPDELVAGLDLQTDERTGLYRLDVDPSTDTSAVFVRFNDDTNQLLLTGPSASMQAARRLVAFADVPPRQIVVEVQIVETNRQVLLDAGIDWQELLDQTQLSFSYTRRGSTVDTDEENRTRTYDEDEVVDEDRFSQSMDREQGQRALDLRLAAAPALGDFIRILKQEGAATVRNTPRIVTTNNRAGTIIDGSRVRYVANLSAYANIYETEELVTGLTLSVVPSLGESGFVKLDVSAELTELGPIIGASPSETGQMLENTVIVREGQPFLLGGLQRHETFEETRKVPLLGTILPFLFSHTVEVERTSDVLLVLTPRLVDFDGPAFDVP